MKRQQLVKIAPQHGRDDIFTYFYPLNGISYMQRVFLLFVCVVVFAADAFAQDDLFGTAKPEAKKGWLIGVSGDVDLPAADMAKRFGLGFRLGPVISYKTKSNWLFGAKCDFILGNKIKEDSLMINLKDNDNYTLDADGQSQSPLTYERGYMIGLHAGRIFNISKKNPDNGITVMAGAGFMQYKINIFNKDNNIPQLKGDYKKGYDRLTNGIFLEQYVGYTYFGKDGLINFHIGLDIAEGFTQGRRDYLFDVMRPDNAHRLDILFGIRGGWYIPIFKRKSDDIYFQ